MTAARQLATRVGVTTLFVDHQRLGYVEVTVSASDILDLLETPVAFEPDATFQGRSVWAELTDTQRDECRMRIVATWRAGGGARRKDTLTRDLDEVRPAYVGRRRRR